MRNEVIKKLILLAMFAGCCATLLLTWVNHHNIQTLDGTSILTGNLFLSVLIFAVYVWINVKGHKQTM